MMQPDHNIPVARKCRGLIDCQLRRFLFSEIGTSVSGAVFHNAGQIAVASVILRGSGIWYYFPALLLAGIVTGLINGMIMLSSSKPLSKLTAVAVSKTRD